VESPLSSVSFDSRRAGACDAGVIAGDATCGFAALDEGDDCGAESGRSSVVCARSRGGSAAVVGAGATGVSRGVFGADAAGVLAGSGGSGRFISGDGARAASDGGIDGDACVGAGERGDSTAGDVEDDGIPDVRSVATGSRGGTGA